MAQGVVIRFKADSTEYDAKLKRSIEQMKSMEDQAKKLQGSIDRTDEGYVKFVQSLGQMETVAKSSKTALREYSEAILYLQQQYKALSDTEKSGDVGKAMAASIQQLKARAAEAQDAIGDLNEELKHMASDTSFTDGIGLMTRTVGSCAAAITAWTGDSKEMEAVIKDLAKIGTTVAAVDQLTKAFQKQNLVLLKNPYVAAAAGVMALIAALAKLATSLNKESEVEKKVAKAREEMAKSQEKYREKVSNSASKIMTTYQRLREEWSRLSTAQQKNEWIQKNKSAFDQLGISINKITDAENAFVNNTQKMVKAFQLRAEASAYESMANDAYAKYILKWEEVKARAVKAGDNVPRGQVVNYKEGGDGLYEYNPTTGGYRYTAKGAKEYNTNLVKESGILDLKHEAEKYVKAQVNLLSKAEKLLGGGNVTPTTVATSYSEKSSKSAGSDFAVFGSLGDWEQQAAQVQQYMKGATSTEEYKELEQDLDFILKKIRDIKGEKELAFTPGSLNDLNQQLREAQDALANMSPEADGWAAALELVRQKMEEVAALQEKINGSSSTSDAGKDMKGLADNVDKAISAFGQLGGAMQQIEDPSAKVAGIIMGAIAEVAGSFAESLKGNFGTWDWIAAAIAGTATMISTIAAIKSATSGNYANGGIIPGNSYSGDRLTANVNSGELILNRAQQDSIAGQLSAGNPFGNLQLSMAVDGTKFLVLLNNVNRSRGGSRNFYTERH